MAAASHDPPSKLWLPRALAPRYSQLRRDLAMVLAGLRGERAPSWLPRDGSRYSAAPASEPSRTGQLATRELEVVEVVRETDSAVSLSLADPAGQPLPELRPGQFFTLLVELDGETLRRAYSISSDCRRRDRVSVTIKRAVGGRVSNHLNETARVGMRLRALGPSGEFGCTPQPDRSAPRRLVLIAGGSGITPMMALMRTLLASERECQIGLIYANRRADQIIFADAIAQLEAESQGRLRVQHLVEETPPEWTLQAPPSVGAWDSTSVDRLLDAEALCHHPDTEFMLCGPPPMMALAEASLDERGVARARVHRESFLAPQLDASAEAKLQAAQDVTLVIGEREVAFVVQPGQSLLEAGLEAGVEMPYSCAMGGCAACKVQLEQGEVVMREPNCLGPREREAGYVLACVANPSAPCRVRLDPPPVQDPARDWERDR